MTLQWRCDVCGTRLPEEADLILADAVCGCGAGEGIWRAAEVSASPAEEIVSCFSRLCTGDGEDEDGICGPDLRFYICPVHAVQAIHGAVAIERKRIAELSAQVAGQGDLLSKKDSALRLAYTVLELAVRAIEDPSGWLESNARDFHHATGLLHPNKDAALATNDDVQERMRAYREWAGKRQEEERRALKAACDAAWDAL